VGSALVLGAGAFPGRVAAVAGRSTASGGRFLFEEARGQTDAASVLFAVCVSLTLHLPLLPLVAAWAPESRDALRERNVTALFDALVEEARIVPIDLAELAQDQATPPDGPAPGEVSLADSPAARGDVSSDSPRRLSQGEARTGGALEAAPGAGELFFSQAQAPGSPGRDGEDSAQDPEGGIALASRIPPPEDVIARSMRAGRGLSPEEAREQRARWFAWYRSLLSERFLAAYPRSRLEREGVRGTLSFKLELAADGSVKSLTVTRADEPAMERALREALAAIGRWPSYEATGLRAFPPFVFSIEHGPAEWQKLSSTM